MGQKVGGQKIAFFSTDTELAHTAYWLNHSRSAVSSTYQLVLVSGDGDEDALSEYPAAAQEGTRRRVFVVVKWVRGIMATSTCCRCQCTGVWTTSQHSHTRPVFAHRFNHNLHLIHTHHSHSFSFYTQFTSATPIQLNCCNTWISSKHSFINL